jgi:signal transduction histidine kinase
MRALVVEDEKKTASFVRKALQAEGFASGSYGLGLSIVQWIVSAHDGTIKNESGPSKITTVTVRLPLPD